METVGKILSLALLTILGSSAATIYLIDSNFISSFFSGETADSEYVTEYEEYDDFPSPSDMTTHRKRLTYFETSPPRDYYRDTSSKSKVWSQSFNDTQKNSFAESLKAKKLSKQHSVRFLREKMISWKNDYDRLVETQKISQAREAYKQYKVYKEAYEIKKGIKN